MATFSVNVDLLVALHTLVLTTLDGGSSNAKIDIRSVSNTLLASIPLANPSGTVNALTGQLTLADSSSPDAIASGTADHANLCDSDGTIWITLPTVAGTSAVDDTLVISSLAVVSGYPVELVSATVG